VDVVGGGVSKTQFLRPVILFLLTVLYFFKYKTKYILIIPTTFT